MRHLPFHLLLCLLLCGGVLPRAHALDAEEIRQKAIRIRAVRDFTVVAEAPGDLRGQSVLIVRLVDDEYEIIATGKVKTQKGDTAEIAIDVDAMKKRPVPADFVVSLGPPIEFVPKKPPVAPEPFALDTEKPPDLEPGYIQLNYLRSSETLVPESPNQANSYKTYKGVTRTGFLLEWFLEFLPNYGLRIETASATVPILSYFRSSVDASLVSTRFRIMYRLKKRSSFRATFFLDSGDDGFDTANTDEYVVSTKANSSKLGATLAWEPGDPLLTATRARFQLTDVRFELAQTIAGQAKDGVVARGETGKLAGRDLRLIVGTTAYLPWMPWVKRWSLSFESYQSRRELAFSGATRSEAGGIYKIPADGAYAESISGWTIWLGFRFEDVIGRTLKPKG